MEIGDVRVEQHPADEGKNGITQPAVQPGHRAGIDPAAPRRQPATHDQVAAPGQLFHQRRDGREIVTEIGIAHDDPAPARGERPRPQRAPVTPARRLDQLRAERPRQGLRAVGAAVVGHHDFTRPAHFLQTCAGL